MPQRIDLKIGGQSEPAPVSKIFSDSNLPWTPRAGESILDGKPAGVPVVNIGTYSSSRDIYVALTAVLNGTSGEVYVQLAPGDYFLNNFHDYGSGGNPSWIGFHNAARIIGLIGAGFDAQGEFLTRLIAVKTMVSSTPGCRDRQLQNTSASNESCTGLYFSNNGATNPLFFSAISFDGDLQEPFGVFSTAAQAAFRRNHTALSPLPWNGFSMWRAKPGSRFQYCRFRGFAFALNSAPPFECGVINTNYNNLVTFACEIDGRVPAYLRSDRPRAAGGWMYNKEVNSSMVRCWIHHTRRSGMATNTNTHSESEIYRFNNFQATNIANIGSEDPWPCDVAPGVIGGFNSWNVEGVVGLFEITDGYANSEHSHINWANGYRDSSGEIFTIPNKLIIRVSGFITDDTTYGGLLRLSVPKQPNSTGISEAWRMINEDFDGQCSRFFDIRSPTGKRLLPVKATLWNSSYTKDDYYLMRSF